jgi:hypothetical protein
MANEPCTFGGVVDLLPIIALVKVLGVYRRQARVRVKLLEVFKGSMPDETDVGVPTLWGKYEFDWFTAGERALLLMTDDPLITFGRLGRMPLLDRDGKSYAASFADDPAYLEGFTLIEERDCLLVTWAELRSFLIARSALERD